MTILQISDTHFGTQQPPVVDALLALVAAESPGLIVMSGDVTQRATNAEFDAAAAFVARLGGRPLLAIPGNHDIPLFNIGLRVVAPYRRYRRVFGPTLEPTRSTPEWLVIGVNTTRRWRHKNGELSNAQIERVASQLARASPTQVRVVVLHHPVAVTRSKDEPNLLQARAAAVRRWAAAGADLVLGGHIHLPYVLPMHEAHPELARRLWVVQAGTAVSDRVRHEAGNSVNLLRRLSAGRTQVERWDYSAPAQAFRRVQTHDLACGALADGARGAG